MKLTVNELEMWRYTYQDSIKVRYHWTPNTDTPCPALMSVTVDFIRVDPVLWQLLMIAIPTGFQLDVKGIRGTDGKLHKEYRDVLEEVNRYRRLADLAEIME